MRNALLLGVLSLFPAATLWGGGPGRRWPCALAAAACAALWAAGFLWAPAPLWAGAGALNLALCLYGVYVVAKNAREYRGLEASLAEREAAHAQLSKKLDVSRIRSKGIESEEREVQALYSMVKGLSEALTWEDLRPKIEVAIQQYLRVEEFAFYVVGLRAEDKPHPLVRRRLGSSVGGSWDSLQRCLQERGLPENVGQILESPERAVTLPVFEGKAMTGFLYARVGEGSDPGALLAKAQNFFDEVAFAFSRIRLFQEVERLSQIDGLTGVFRRGILDEKLKDELVRAQTFKTSFCLMLLDIDHFKVLNDKYGHPFGDEVLKRVGQVLKAGVYETDFVARYGGEEFAILLPRADPAGVRRKAEAIRQAVESQVFELAMEHIRISVSIGIAHYPRDADTVEGVIRQTDQALYHAKDTGRNRVVDIAEVQRSL